MTRTRRTVHLLPLLGMSSIQVISPAKQKHPSVPPSPLYIFVPHVPITIAPLSREPRSASITRRKGLRWLQPASLFPRFWPQWVVCWSAKLRTPRISSALFLTASPKFHTTIDCPSIISSAWREYKERLHVVEEYKSLGV